jgi:glycosyltransferase involved in cell wall biosynthesis
MVFKLDSGQQMPKVSVIIPTYNRSFLLRRAIQSVLSQTFQDFELIIVDDASTDDTDALVKSFEDDQIGRAHV